MAVICIDSKIVLESQLEALSSEVGSRVSGRNQEAKENWILKHYLRILGFHDLLSYPVCLLKRESPDFWVNEEQKSYGVEITESTSEFYQALLTKRAKNPDMDFARDSIQYGRSYSKDDFNQFLKPSDRPLNRLGWIGVQAEKDAANWARDAVEKKLTKIESWELSAEAVLRILLYDNSPASIYDLEAFQRMLKNKLRALFEERRLKEEPKIDFISPDGTELVYDILNSDQILKVEK